MPEKKASRAGGCDEILIIEDEILGNSCFWGGGAVAQLLCYILSS